MTAPSPYNTLRNLLKGTAPFTGQAFIAAAVRGFAKELKSDFAFITKVTDPLHHTVEVISAWKNGKEIDAWHFQLHGTPCELIYEKQLDVPWSGMRVGQSIAIADSVCELFDSTRDTPYKSFIGIPLWTRELTMTGHVALFFERDLNDDMQRQVIVELAELFSYKVQAELNRMLLEEARESLLADLKIANERLEHDSITDSLTNLYNRRYFTERMEQAFARQRRSMEQCALMLIDLDHLKTINDRAGHQAGDMALAQVADTLKATTRAKVELVFRIGGDEFAILLGSGVNDEALSSLGRRIKATLGNSTLKHDGEALALTVSIGAAQMSASDHSWHDLYVRADKALYTAKQQGRQRMVVAA